MLGRRHQSHHRLYIGSIKIAKYNIFSRSRAILQLFRIGIRTHLWEAIDNTRTAIQFYRFPLFRKAHLAIKRQYFSTPVETLCRWALKDFPDDQVQRDYGETSTTAFANLLDQLELPLDAQGKAYELGCGRGELSFWLSSVRNIPTVGVDLNSVFIERAEKIRRRLNITNLEFRCTNMMDLNYHDACLIYVYGTGFKDAAIHHLKKALLSANPKAPIITTSYSLSEIDTPGISPNAFRVHQKIPLKFSWGTTLAFIQYRNKA